MPENIPIHQHTSFFTPTTSYGSKYQSQQVTPSHKGSKVNIIPKPPDQVQIVLASYFRFWLGKSSFRFGRIKWENAFFVVAQKFVIFSFLYHDLYQVLKRRKRSPNKRRFSLKFLNLLQWKFSQIAENSPKSIIKYLRIEIKIARFWNIKKWWKLRHSRSFK